MTTVLDMPTATRFSVYANGNGVFADARADGNDSWGWMRDPVRAALWPRAWTLLLAGESEAVVATALIEDPYGYLTVAAEFAYTREAADATPAYSALYMENHLGNGTPGESGGQYDIGIVAGASILTWDVPEGLREETGGAAVVAVNTTIESAGVDARLYFASDSGLGAGETLAEFAARALSFGVTSNNGTVAVDLSGLTFGAKLHALAIPDGATQWLPTETVFDALAPGGLTVTGGGVRLRGKICVGD